MDERKWDIQVDKCLLMEGVRCSPKNTVTDERELQVARRRQDGGEEPNNFILFIYLFLILVGLIKGIFDIHIF